MGTATTHRGGRRGVAAEASGVDVTPASAHYERCELAAWMNRRGACSRRWACAGPMLLHARSNTPAPRRVAANVSSPLRRCRQDVVGSPIPLPPDPAPPPPPPVPLHSVGVWGVRAHTPRTPLAAVCAAGGGWRRPVPQPPGLGVWGAPAGGGRACSDAPPFPPCGGGKGGGGGREGGVPHSARGGRRHRRRGGGISRPGGGGGGGAAGTATRGSGRLPVGGVCVVDPLANRALSAHAVAPRATHPQHHRRLTRNTTGGSPALPSICSVDVGTYVNGHG